MAVPKETTEKLMMIAGLLDGLTTTTTDIALSDDAEAVESAAVEVSVSLEFLCSQLRDAADSLSSTRRTLPPPPPARRPGQA